MTRPPTIGIFGGSFNPVHNGHLALARYIASSGLVDNVWLTLSPLNPLKNASAVSEADRLAMLEIAVKDMTGISVCDIELSLPQPSYTINTLNTLQSIHPDYRFRLITGADNLAIFDRWRDGRRIIEDYGLIVYPRPGYTLQESGSGITTLPGAPLYDISSTEIRHRIAHGNDVSTLLPHSVYQYILKHHLYNT